jgi:hypothetical protein
MFVLEDVGKDKRQNSGNKEKEPSTDEVQRIQVNTKKSRWGKIFLTRPDCPGTHPTS